MSVCCAAYKFTRQMSKKADCREKKVSFLSFFFLSIPCLRRLAKMAGIQMIPIDGIINKFMISSCCKKSKRPNSSISFSLYGTDKGERWNEFWIFSISLLNTHQIVFFLFPKCIKFNILHCKLWSVAYWFLYKTLISMFIAKLYLLL